MAGILHSLENNEAILLMYLADELGAEDRAEVAHMLERDGGLRAELERLRGMQEGFVAGMERLDRAEPAPARDEAAVRRLMRAMRRFQTELALRPAMVREEDAPRRLPAWSYPLVGAAAAIFIVLGLWGFGVIELPTPHGGNVTKNVNTVASEQDEPAAPGAYDPNNVAWGLNTDTSARDLDEAAAHANDLQTLRAGDVKSDPVEEETRAILML